MPGRITVDRGQAGRAAQLADAGQFHGRRGGHPGDHLAAEDQRHAHAERDAHEREHEDELEPRGETLGRDEEASRQWKMALSLVDRMTEREKYRTLGVYFGTVTRDYEKAIPEGYFVCRTPTFRNLFFFRAFLKGDDFAGTANALKAKFRMYPLAQAANPPTQKFMNCSGKQFNTVHANNFKFYEELNAVVQYEPADAFNPELVGQFASIGIKKGQPFNPDARMKKILTEAVAVGNATARALSFAPRKQSVFFYPDRKWNSPFAGLSYEFLNNGERVLDDRIFFHYVATGITPAMAAPKVGTGSAYAFTTRDSQDNYLDGGKNYTVTLPAPVPVNNFWSFMVYSGQHRSMLETDQKLAGLDSNNPSVKPNADGSYTMWFGPAAPQGHEGNWIQTMPGKSFNCLLRLYGPLQPWFDKTWRPGEIEMVQ